eukprot:7559906-Alexandrium_andersonii.AAC.1
MEQEGHRCCRDHAQREQPTLLLWWPWACLTGSVRTAVPWVLRSVQQNLPLQPFGYPEAPWDSPALHHTCKGFRTAGGDAAKWSDRQKLLENGSDCPRRFSESWGRFRAAHCC